MNEIQFEDKQDEFGAPPQMNQGTDFTGKLIGWGLASNRQQAEYLMIGLAVVIIIISFFVYRWGSSPGQVGLPPVEDPTELIN